MEIPSLPRLTRRRLRSLVTRWHDKTQSYGSHKSEEICMSQCEQLADQIRRAFDGQAWHGDSMKELLADVSAKQAFAHPVKGAHSIWELLLHVAAWDNAVLRRIGGSAVKLTKEENFPLIRNTSPAA